jgi:hypothetical protein
MPDTSDPPRPPLRLKLAALSLAGAAVVALPLAQVLRYQGAELQAALTEQAALDPVARAVALQHGLLRHRDLAAQVLRGQEALEAQRRSQQERVDERAAELDTALAAVASDRAQSESRALREDWALLAGDVQKRAISAAGSNLGHRLLMEQTLQVIDFVADTSGLGRGHDASANRLASAMTGRLPRLLVEIAALQPVATAGGHAPDERQVAAIAGALARSLGHLSENIEHEGAAHARLAAATAASGVAVERYFRLLREESAAAEQAGQAAVSAQFRLLDETHAVVSAKLAARIDEARQERNLLLACAAVLALLSILLTGRIALPPRPRSPRRRADAHPHGDSAVKPTGVATAGRVYGSATVLDETGLLLQRMRRVGTDRPASRRGGAPAESLPPEEN